MDTSVRHLMSGTVGLKRRTGSVPRTAIGLAVLTMVAFAVRLVHLGSDPIWFDEAASMGIAVMDWHTILGPMANAESSPPGYYLLARIWTSLFGWDIVTLRMLSVLAGAVAVPVMWTVGNRAFGEAEGWIAAAFVAFSATHVRLSQDARCYACLFLLVTLALLAGQRLTEAISRDRPAWRHAVVLGALMALMLWLHATAVFIAISLNLMVMCSPAPSRNHLSRGLPCLITADVLMVCLAAMPIGAMIRHAFLSESFADRWIEPLGLFEVARLYGRALVAPFLGPISPLAGILQAGLLSCAALAWWRSRSPMITALGAMLVVGAVELPLISVFVPVLLDRTALFLLAPLALLLAAGTMRLPHRAIAPIVTVLIGLQALGVAGWHRLEVRKERWDLAADVLHRKLRIGEPIIMTESAFLEISITASLRAVGAVPPRILIVPPTAKMEQLAADALHSDQITSGDGLSSLFRASGSVWLVMRDQPASVDDDIEFTSRGSVRKTLAAAGGRIIDELRFPGVELEHWTAPGR